MRKVENLDAYITLEQLSLEVYNAARQMAPEDRMMEGEMMRKAITHATTSLVHGCSTKNDRTLIPYIEGAYRYSEEFRQHLRTCKRLRLMPDADVDFLLQRQLSLSSQLIRLLRRTTFNADQSRNGKVATQDVVEAEAEPDDQLAPV